MIHRILSVTMMTLPLMMAGCSGRPTRIEPPAIDSVAVGTAVLSKYDRDGDETLSKSELQAIPSLNEAVDRVDSDKDGKITAGEVTQRIQNWQKLRVGLMRLVCQVKLDGQPLEGASVTLTPEPFLGDEVLSAEGLTDAHGMAPLSIAEEFRVEPNITGVQCGWYQVRVSKLENGQETLPAKYNSETTLGCEVASDNRNIVPGLQFDLLRN